MSPAKSAKSNGPKAAKSAKARKSPAKPAKRAMGKRPLPPVKPGEVRMLSGGNPQIAKGDGDAPVQAYIQALSGWKRDVTKRMDAIIAREVPGVRKAVKWNSPFYGVEGQGWFASVHVFTSYVKLTFFAGTSLRPVPPGGTEKSKAVRWVDVREGALDEAQVTAWVKQAAAVPGWLG